MAWPAPIKATPEEVVNSPRKWGYKAIAVPTNVAVLDYALHNYGSLTTSEVLKPAIKLAEKGYPVTPLYHHLSSKYLNSIRRGTVDQVPLSWTTIHQPISPGTWHLHRYLRNTETFG